MKKLNLITEFDEIYKGSDLQKIVNKNSLPIKHTINGFDCYFYNADLVGLFEWKIQKNDLTADDFIDDYKKGFEAGLSHLKNKEKIKLKDLKSKDLREGTVNQLKNILFDREFEFGSNGLLDLVFNKVPLIFTEKVIYNYGYWNGIIYSIDDIRKKAGLKTNELMTLPLQQLETVKPDEVKKELHNHIFKGNSFEVFEKYHNNKSLAENSRTDLNLLFQLFQNDNLFVETVELKHYIQWLNKTYGYVLTELKKVDINSKPNIQRTNDYKEYKKTTLKQP